jgi:membrane associated rhomboid family serine protease
MTRWRFQWWPTLVFTLLGASFGLPPQVHPSYGNPAIEGAAWELIVGVVLGGFVQSWPRWKRR